MAFKTYLSSLLYVSVKPNGFLHAGIAACCLAGLWFWQPWVLAVTKYWSACWRRLIITRDTSPSLSNHCLLSICTWDSCSNKPAQWCIIDPMVHVTLIDGLLAIWHQFSSITLIIHARLGNMAPLCIDLKGICYFPYLWLYIVSVLLKQLKGSCSKKWYQVSDVDSRIHQQISTFLTAYATTPSSHSRLIS